MRRLVLFLVTVVSLAALPVFSWASPAVTGTVSNLSTGSPVSGVRMRLFDANGPEYPIGDNFTQADGTYNIVAPGPGLYRVLADLSVGSPLADQFYGGGVRPSSAGLVIISTDTEVITGVNIPLPAGYSMVGKITGSGVALDNFDMDVYHEFGETLPSFNATTTVGGFYEIGPFPNGTYILRADPNATLEQAFLEKYYGGNSYAGSATKIIIADSSALGIDIDLDPAGIIKGVIQDSLGNKLVGIDLDILHPSGFRLPYNGLSKADGIYRAGALPAGTYYVKADPKKNSGYGRAIYPNSLTLEGAKLVVITDGQITDGINFTLPPAGTISGTIRDAVTLDPMPFVDLDIYNLAGEGLEFTARTDLDGAYTFGPLPVGQYIVKSDPNSFSGYIVQYFNSAIARSSASPVTVTASTDTANTDFLLSKGGNITGTIFDTNGAPLSGIDLDIYDASGARLDASASTWIDGTYSVGPLPDGDYFVKADPDPLLGHFTMDAFYPDVADIASATPVTISGGTATGIDVNLRFGGVISGTIRDAGGQPIPGIDLDAYDLLGSRLNVSATSDWDGTYLIGALPAGDYFLRADPPGDLRLTGAFYDSDLTIGSATTISVVASMTTANIDFALNPGGSISGSILGPDGSPLPGIDLDVFDAAGKFFDSSATSQFDGTFIINGLPDGDYYVKADPDTLLGQWYVDSYFGGSYKISGATLITLAGSDVNGLTLSLQAGGTISGLIRGEGGLPLSGIDLDVFDAGGHALSFSARTGPDGVYTIGPIPAGNYRVKADPDELTDYTGLYFNSQAVKSEATLVTVVNALNTSDVDFDLFKGGWVSGKILSDSGSPLNHVDLDMFTATGARVDATARTGPDGSYTLGPVPAGDYVIRADPDDTTGHLVLHYPDAFNFNAASPITIVAAQTLPDINFSLPVAGWIEGLVADESGTPLVGIDMDAFNSVTQARLTQGGVTGADGRYLIGPLPVQGIVVRADPDAEQGFVREYYNESLVLRDAAAVAVAGGIGVSDIDFTLSAGAQVSGRVVDPVKGSPIQSADIDVYRLSDGFLMDQNAKTDGNGSYSVGLLPEGTYIIKIDALSSTLYTDTYYGDTQDPDLAIPVSVNAGNDLDNLNVSLPGITRFAYRIEIIDGIRKALFEFKTETGKNYIIESSEMLLPGSWTLVTSITGDGSFVTYAEPIPSVLGSLFFRVRFSAP